MRRSIKNRLTWATVGFLLGVATTILYGAWNLWEFQEDILLHWVRWMGKETIKWTFIAVVFVIVAFVVSQLLNLVMLARQERRKNNPNSDRPT